MTQGTVAVIGGSGLNSLTGYIEKGQLDVETPFGPASAPPQVGEFNGRDLIFLARHGQPHTIAPHQINYRANIWALREAGAKRIISFAAVGGIDAKLKVGDFVIPDQIIDYTHGRETSFYDGIHMPLDHIDFTYPYDLQLRTELLRASEQINKPAHASGTLGITQGPRLETAAEVKRLAADGCDLVGMTGMPEAALARELGMSYACCAIVSNVAAGIDDKTIDAAAVENTLKTANESAMLLLAAALSCPE